MRRLALVGLVFAAGCSMPTPVQNVQNYSQANLTNTVLSYLTNPKFSNNDMMFQMTGVKAELQMHNLDEGKIYFSMPESEYRKDSLDKMLVDPKGVEFATTADGQFTGDRLALGNYVLRKPGNLFFRIPKQNFKVDPNKKIVVNYGPINYTQSLVELENFISNRSVYGGGISVKTGGMKFGKPVIISNHGAFVARQEASLTRLVRSIVAPDASNEKKAQELLNFVTYRLKYDFDEAGAGVETLKRPNEVLMSKGSDCSGMTILYASLLEQTDIQYRLVYMPQHISVAVHGDFPSTNGMHFNLGDKTFYFAETTCKGFRIGSSKVNREFTLDDVLYIQKPGSDVFDAKNGKALEFF